MSVRIPVFATPTADLFLNYAILRREPPAGGASAKNKKLSPSYCHSAVVKVSFLEYVEDAYGDPDWIVSMIDGWPDEDVLRRFWETRPGAIPEHHPPGDIGGIEIMADRARMEFVRAHPYRPENQGQQEEGPGHRRQCDLWVVKPEPLKGEHPNLRKAIAPHLQPLEDHPPEGITYFLQMSRGCPFYRECLEATAKGPTVKSRDPQKDMTEAEYREFAKRFEKLADEIVGAYVAPCGVVAEKLLGLDYTVIG